MAAVREDGSDPIDELKDDTLNRLVEDCDFLVKLNKMSESEKGEAIRQVTGHQQWENPPTPCNSLFSDFEFIKPDPPAMQHPDYNLASPFHGYTLVTDNPNSPWQDRPGVHFQLPDYLRNKDNNNNDDTATEAQQPPALPSGNDKSNYYKKIHSHSNPWAKSTTLAPVKNTVDEESEESEEE
ncbi:MAG: hypothetical protein M1831_000987 [Alyxoria varia]|nr:MAG: hypothetical protein M1831_000987 [Alyxoria varia]